MFLYPYISKSYDRINLTVTKGKKADIKAHADSQKESVNGFINRAIDETMERDNSVLPDDTTHLILNQRQTNKGKH